MDAKLKPETGVPSLSATKKFLDVRIGEQVLGIPVPVIQDVVQGLKVSPVPLAPAHVLGLLNLRGRIVAAIDVRASLELPRLQSDNMRKAMCIIVEHKGEFFSLVVDSVGEITEVADDKIERNPDNLSERWKAVSNGIYKLNNRLMVIANIAKLIGV